MKLMIASDIHGSAPDLQRLLERFREEGADRLILLGDILYHGPRNDLPDGYAPKQVIALLNPLAERMLCVRGNCEAEVDQMVLDFPVMADYAVLLDGDRQILLTHGHRFNEQQLPPIPQGSAMLYGHTHVPVLHREKGILFGNPGSVSIPKNGSTRGYMMYENGCFTRKDLDGNAEMTLEF